MSALWHGFYPGYFISFFFWSIMITNSKYVYKWSTNYPKLFDNMKKRLGRANYYIARFLLVNIPFNAFGATF